MVSGRLEPWPPNVTLTASDGDPERKAAMVMMMVMMVKVVVMVMIAMLVTMMTVVMALWL